MTFNGSDVLSVVLLLSLVLGAHLKYSKLRRRPLGTHLPPGPKGRPLIGNAREMATPRQYELFARWAKEYGDIFYVKALMQNMVIINSADVAHELLDQRSSMYSDRGNFTMINELMGGDWNFAFMRYGERWRMHRRAFHQKFQLTAIPAYYPIQIQQTHALMKRLFTSPQDFWEHLRHHSGAIIMQVVYGIKVLPKDDPYIQIAEEASSALSDVGGSGAFLVDVLPILKYVPAWFPGASFQRKARLWRTPMSRLCTEPFAVAKTEFEKGGVGTSFVGSSLEKLSHKKDRTLTEEEIVRNSGAAAYAAGAETTSLALTWFLLAMVLFPEVQRKAQAELDAVFQDRLPTFSDRDKLPYINALCMEIHRWRPVAPLAVPHRATQDDTYGNYFIPAGSLVIGNSWAILHDERVYGSNAEEFDPDRFLKAGSASPEAAFGYGRRKCPGQHLAENTVFITAACILRLFNVTPQTDILGNTIPVAATPRPGFFSQPEEFVCKITPRSKFTERALSHL